MDKAAPVIVARTWTDSEASVIKSLLESYSIPCHYASELPHRIYPASVDGLGEIRIFVPAAFAQEARQILEEHRRREAPLRLVDDDEPEGEKA
jgi:flagellar biosynthesis protein FlhB